MVNQPCTGKERDQAIKRTQKQSEEGNIIKDIRNLFKLKKENEATKDWIIRNNSSLFQQE